MLSFFNKFLSHVLEKITKVKKINSLFDGCCIKMAHKGAIVSCNWGPHPYEVMKVRPRPLQRILRGSYTCQTVNMLISLYHTDLIQNYFY